MTQTLLKTFFVLLTAITLMPCSAQADDVIINETNFPDAKFRNYLLGQYYGADGKLTVNEINDIRTLFVSGYGISSLRGIEHLAALEYQICSNNQLSALDMSKNTALTALVCYNNQLTTLDMSKNTALKDLSCYENQLTVLDVSGCTALTSLSCDKNQLTALDMSGCSALTSLTCSENQLAALDVSNSTALTELICHTNQLTSLDVSNNIALRRLLCGANQLTELDVSKNADLIEIECGHNLLTALDLTNNTVLGGLMIHHNKIEKAAMEVLISSLPQQNGAMLIAYDNSEGDEGNVCTKEQVKAAKAKGWIVYFNNNEKWQVFEGVDDSDGIEGVKADRADRGSAPVYRVNGQRLPKPMKGLNIIGGKKVIVK